MSGWWAVAVASLLAPPNLLANPTPNSATEPARGAQKAGDERDRAKRWQLTLTVLGVVAAAIVWLEGPWRWVCLPAAIWTIWTLRKRPEPGAAESDLPPDDLAEVAILLATLLRAGASPQVAASTTAKAISGSCSRSLSDVVGAVAVAVPPTQAWESVRERPGMSSLAALMVRATESGAPVADSLERLARDEQFAALSRAQARARAITVRTLLPLGLCYLPAFVALAVVPLVGSLAGRVLA